MFLDLSVAEAVSNPGLVSGSVHWEAAELGLDDHDHLRQLKKADLTPQLNELLANSSKLPKPRQLHERV